MSISILIIDDDLNFRKLLKLRVLSLNTNKIIERKIQVKEVSSLSEAKILIEQELPNLILLDQHLPDGLGSDLIENELSRNDKTIHIPVISLSSDDSPELPGSNIKKGAKLFIPKADISKPYFLPLLEAIISKADSDSAIRKSNELKVKMETIQTLIKTLNHEINNPLGVLYGAEFILGSKSTTEEEKEKAIQLIKESTSRIKKILQELSTETNLEEVNKGGENLFHLSSDKNWSK